MVSYVVITLAVFLGLVAFGAMIPLGILLLRRFDSRLVRRGSHLVSRIELQTRAATGKPLRVMTEADLAHLTTKHLTKEEIQRLLQQQNTETAPLSRNVGQDDCAIDIEDTRAVDGYFTQDCIVCLADFAPGEVVRQLKCGHYFHTQCIDSWLTKQSATCPICKTDLLAALSEPQQPAPVAVAVSVAIHNQNSSIPDHSNPHRTREGTFVDNSQAVPTAAL
ncbi:hypothetical protein FB639_003650 [Coemansia asiatica]|nr:hypothetical protein FB639_003650 [Coemansia asiatica]